MKPFTSYARAVMSREHSPPTKRERTSDASTDTRARDGDHEGAHTSYSGVGPLPAVAHPYGAAAPSASELAFRPSAHPDAGDGRPTQATGHDWVHALSTLSNTAMVERLFHLAEHGTLGGLVHDATPAQHHELQGLLLGKCWSLPLTPQLKEVARVIFDHSPNHAVQTLIASLRLRFHIAYVGKEPAAPGQPSHGVQWDARGLRMLFATLEALPPSHVEGNADLNAIVRFKSTGGPGGRSGYTAGDRIGFSYHSRNLDVQDSHADPHDTFHEHPFDAMVRHEIGHTVDEIVHGSSTWGHAKEGGDWRDYSNNNGHAIDDLFAEAHLSRIFDESQLHDLKKLFEKVLATRDTKYFDDIQKFDWYKHELAHQDAKFGPILRALDHVTNPIRAGFGAPWAAQDGGASQAVNGRVFQAVGGTYWTSYSLKARARRVSDYQFYAPAEWFAEAYSAYYEPDPRGKGAKLEARDPATKRWFDEHVAHLHATRAPGKHR
jgi:hypothetical protein